jgi:25S rRNA (uracil2634-N3)-methyltransferase
MIQTSSSSSLAPDNQTSSYYNYITMPKHKKLKRALAIQAESKRPSSKKPQQQQQKSSTNKAQPQPKASKPQPTIPFESEDHILLIGEGDFSFATSLVEHHGACDLTATSFDSQTTLYEKYTPQAEKHTTFLTDEGQTVLYNIDATKLEKYKSLTRAPGGLWDVIIFNFPHVGGKSTDVNRQVRFNQELLVAFFKGAMALVKQGGRIVVTLFEGEPYTLWNIRDLGRHVGLEMVRSFAFQSEAYPGYKHARTLGNVEGGGGWKGEEREARSYVLRRRDADGPVANRPHARVAAPASGVKRGRESESGSDDEDG